MKNWIFLDFDNTTAVPMQEVTMTIMQRIKRIRCWFRGHHERGAYRFRYDVSGICEHCGVVGTGKEWEYGE